MIRAVRQLRVASDKVNRVAGIHYKVLGRKTDTELQSFLFPARGEGEDNLTDKVSISRQGSIQVQCQCNLHDGGGVSTF